MHTTIRRVIKDATGELTILITPCSFQKNKLNKIYNILVKELTRLPNMKSKMLFPINQHIKNSLAESNKNLQIREYDEKNLEDNCIFIIDNYQGYKVFLSDFDVLKIKKLDHEQMNLAISIFRVLWNKPTNPKYDYASNQMYLDFINICAHELKSPLHSIVMQSDILLNITREMEQLEMLQSIYDNSNRLGHIIDDLLEMSRIESNLLRLDKVKFNLNHFMNDLVSTYNRILMNDKSKRNSVKLDFQDEGSMLYVDADRERLRQVLVNLLNNAIRFTEIGKIKIILKQYNVDDILISISDTGPGISKEIHDKLFSKFNTTSTKGLGLGLYIAKNIVNLHNGNIWATNNKPPSKGCTFNIQLPTVKHLMGEGVRVLIVHNDKRFISLLQSRLEQIRYKVVTLTKISQLEGEFIYGYYDMILIDQVIESEDKNNTIKKIKSKEQIKICYLTKGKTNYDSFIGLYQTPKDECYVNSNSNMDNIISKIDAFHKS